MTYSFVKNILLVSVLFFSNLSISQADNLLSNDNFVGDNIIIHVDKSFYVTGEVMWYKIYLPKNFEGKPVTLKVSLLNKLGTTKHYSFHATEGKSYFSSYYKIPFDTQSGVYSLIVSGIKTTTGKSVKIAEVGVPIYNDLEKVSIGQSDLATPENVINNTPTISDNPLKVNVSLDKSTYTNRDQVNVNIKVTDASGNPIQGNCSVAVTDNSIAGDMTMPTGNILGGAFPPNIIAKNLNNSINVRGLFLNKDNQPKEVEVMGIFSSKENKFLFAGSNKDGEFSVATPIFSGEKPIQFVNYYEIDNDVTIKLSEDVKRELKQELVYTEGIIEYLKLSRERKKIFQMFEGFEFDVQSIPTKFEKQNLNPDKEYNLRNYSTFEDLPMFFTEVLTYLKFKKSGKKFIAQMTNPTPTWEGFYPGDPLFIVDGKITRDADYVARMEYSHLEQVDLFFDQKKLKDQFNVLGKSGVVTISTDLPKIILPKNDESRIFSINGLQPEANFPVFETSQVNNNKRLPFFRPQLYWNPNVTIQPNGEGRFSFTQTDDDSTFKVRVIVQGENGEMGYGETVYEVKMR